MAFTAERQAFGCYLYPYIILDPWNYETLEHYKPTDSDYIDIVRSHLPEGWATRQVGIWLRVQPPGAVLQPEGFKIHISSVPSAAREVLNKVVPALIGAKAFFKITVDSRILAVVTSKNFPRELSGKFLTVYPTDMNQFRELIEQLSLLTGSFAGPYILSDKRYKDSKVVFYRYGCFIENYQFNSYGEQVSYITCGTDQRFEDIRTAFCQFPEGIADPFREKTIETAQQNEQVVLRGRYRIEDAMSFTNAGGVYRATDLSDGSAVVLKEARPHVGADVVHTGDAISRLERERDILEKLKDFECIAQIVDYFTEWEHSFLVTKYVTGFLLPSFQSQEDVGLLTARVSTPGAVERFSRIFIKLSKNLLSAVETCHSASVIIGDLAPQNVIVDPDTLAVTLIDFGNAHMEGDREICRAFTPGFVLPHVMAGARPTFDDDHYALRRLLCSIVYPIQSLSVISEVAEARLLRAVMQDYRLPSHTKRFVRGLIEAPKECSIKEIERRYCSEGPSETDQTEASENVDTRRLTDVIGRIASYIRATTSLGRTDRLWPADYRGFSAHPLCLAYGALGISLFLQAAEKDTPREADEWIQSRPLDAATTAPGFYTGLAGIAWGLWLLGSHQRAASILRGLANFQTQHLIDDLFYGAAGIGLSQLFLWHSTHDAAFLDNVCEIANRLCRNAQTTAGGKCWPHPDGIPYNGLGHGGSGISLFLLMAHQATGDPQYHANALAGLEHVIANASDSEGCLAWARFPGDAYLWPYWRSGTAGIGSVLLRFFALTRDDRYMELATRTARYLFNRYTLAPGQFNGLGGIGEFFIDIYQQTSNQEYLEQAWGTARRILLFRIEKPEGICFPGEELMRISNDFGTGAAGIGMFLLRLINQSPHPFLDGYDYDNFLTSAASATTKKTSISPVIPAYQH